MKKIILLIATFVFLIISPINAAYSFSNARWEYLAIDNGWVYLVDIAPGSITRQERQHSIGFNTCRMNPQINKAFFSHMTLKFDNEKLYARTDGMAFIDMNKKKIICQTSIKSSWVEIKNNSIMNHALHHVYIATKIRNTREKIKRIHNKQKINDFSYILKNTNNSTNNRNID